MAKRDGAASIQGDAIRITPLKIDGTIDTTKPVLTTNGFITASFGTEFEDGDEISEKAADGHICIAYKADDSLKQITFNLSLCSPDPEASALIAGGKVIVATDQVLLDPTQPVGPNNPVIVDIGDPVGYSSPTVGATVGNPVAIEIWSKAIINGKPAQGQPYWHWAFPYVRVRYEGDREFTNGALANEFSGTGVGNEALVPGGLQPNTADDFVTYREALVNPFSYVRSAMLPQRGWSGGVNNDGEWTWTADNAIGPGFTGTTEVKSAAKPYDTFSAEPTITAEDAANAGLLAGLGYVASPTTAWTPGQYMRVGYYDFHWTGTAWAAGAVPIPVTTAIAGQPGSFAPTNANVFPANAAGATTMAIVASPTTVWTTGQYVQGTTAGVGGEFHWNGTAWTAGRAP